MSRKQHLTFWNLVAITVVSVDTIRNLPVTALFGSTLIFFFLLAAVLFLIPSGLVSAELSARFANPGGIYTWIRQAFGKEMGFVAVWLQWVSNLIWYPTILSYIAGTTAYLAFPSMASNPWYLCLSITVAIWTLTILNLRGIKQSAQFATLCTIAGLVIPMAVIIAMGVLWVISGKPLAIDLSPSHWIPHHQHNMWVALTGIVLSFCGMEIATVHCKDVKDPGKTFPKALVLSTFIIMSTLLLGSLSIAIVLPTNDINLVTGIMQAFDQFFNAYHIHAVMPLLTVMLVVGGLGAISNWVISPARSLLITGEEGFLPKRLISSNHKGAPDKVLIYQAILVTLISTSFVLIPSINESYWILSVVSSQLYMLMYIIMFAAFIKHRLRGKQAHKLHYHIPGGKYWGGITIAVMGIAGSVLPFCVGFIPPEEVINTSMMHYALMLCGVLAVFIVPSIFFVKQYRTNKSRHAWQKLAG